MNRHLSSQQIAEWLIGEGTREMEGHVRGCEYCSRRLSEMEVPLQLFGGAVRHWASQTECASEWAPPASRWTFSWDVWRWGIALTALLIMLATPLYQRESARKRAAAAAASAAQDELLLREVQSGLSRSVPAPMEPVARLMWNQ
ncbi:MAG TPA: hypothetical protein VGL72_22285 [Bryobacteraceae bacterium]|jgi:hypothetical protein